MDAEQRNGKTAWGRAVRLAGGLFGVTASCLAQGTVVGATDLLNPTDRTYESALVRLKADVPGGPFVVRSAGREVPYQIERMGDRGWIWVCADFAPGQSNRFEVATGEPTKAPPRVAVRREGDACVLDNGVVAVKVPAVGGEPRRGPLLSLRLADGRWVGRSMWSTKRGLARFGSETIGDGTLFGKVRLRYEFEGMAGAAGDVPAFAEVDVKLGPGWRHVEIAERHEMTAGDFWEFVASDGWAPREGRSKPFSAGPGSGSVPMVPAPDRALLPGGLPNQRPDLFISLLPRWNQHYKDGWFFAATDGAQAVGAIPVLAGRWTWPHDNALDVVVDASGGYSGVRCPVRRGGRLWWVLAGEAGSAAGSANLDYFHRYAFENLDKINHDFILGWAGRKGAWFRINPYDGAQINPTGIMRQLRRALLPKAGQDGDLTALYQAQTYLHPDTYGTSWTFWSPENPNFFTDYIHVPVLLATQLKGHPRFEELRRLAERRVFEDVYHSFTLPGGAGQECPGYMAGAWEDAAGLCRTHLGFDPGGWDRMKARTRFKKRISQPDGAIRRTLPMGDTHPGPDGPREQAVPPEEVATFATEELPGFGVIFNSRPGTPRETYLSFKAGPNRGHYHGDQLSVVANFDARPAVVDHHCSYRPRSGQEHMHNRVAFFSRDLPYLNMDGYERLIALKTSALADVAIAQVESDRLRATHSQAPELWDQRWPTMPLASPLVYRRTVVFLKGETRDVVVLRDQYRAPVALGAAFCLHVRDESVVAWQSQGAAAAAWTDGTAALMDPTGDFAALGVEPGWVLDVGSRQKGSESPFTQRYEVRAVQPHALTLDRPAPAATNLACTLYRTTARRDGCVVAAGGVSVVCAAPKEFRTRAFPWRHENGKPESTQGIRIETEGVQGEFVTAIVKGDARGVEPMPGGVRADGVDVTFGGGWSHGPDDAVVTVTRAGRAAVVVTARDVDMDRSQGDIGLFVPDAGYPFGDIPDWLVRQRAKDPVR